MWGADGVCRILLVQYTLSEYPIYLPTYLLFRGVAGYLVGVMGCSASSLPLLFQHFGLG